MGGLISTPNTIVGGHNTLDYLFSSPSGKMFGARWNHSPGETLFRKNAEHVLSYQLSGNTNVERLQGGRVTGSRSRIGGSTFIPQDSKSDWRIGGNVQVLHIYLPNDLLLSYAQENFELDTAPEIEEFFSVPDPWLDGLFRMLACEGPSDNLKGVHLETLLLDQVQMLLISHLFSRYSRKFDTHRTRQGLTSFSGSLRNRVVNNINQFVESRLAEDICLNDLADIACMSKNHFLRVFRETVGQTPYNYVMALRIERARKLLKQKPIMPIAEVARQTGFKNLSHFSTTFRRIAAITPSSYRALNT